MFTHGRSPSSGGDIYSMSPVRIAWPLVSVSLCFDFFFYSGRMCGGHLSSYWQNWWDLFLVLRAVSNWFSTPQSKADVYWWSVCTQPLFAVLWCDTSKCLRSIALFELHYSSTEDERIDGWVYSYLTDFLWVCHLTFPKSFPDQNLIPAYKKTTYCWMHFFTWLQWIPNASATSRS